MPTLRTLTTALLDELETKPEALSPRARMLIRRLRKRTAKDERIGPVHYRGGPP